MLHALGAEEIGELKAPPPPRVLREPKVKRGSTLNRPNRFYQLDINGQNYPMYLLLNFSAIFKHLHSRNATIMFTKGHIDASFEAPSVLGGANGPG